MTQWFKIPGTWRGPVPTFLPSTPAVLIFSSTEFLFLCPLRAWDPQTASSQQIIRTACPPWPKSFSFRQNNPHSVTRNCGFPPILKACPSIQLKKKKTHCICLAYVSMLRVGAFSCSVPPCYRLLSCPRTVSIFLIMQLKTISEWICTRGKELNCAGSLGSVIACLLTAWLFYLNLL